MVDAKKKKIVSIIFLLCSISAAISLTITILNQTDFSSGTFTSTFFNTTSGALELNRTVFTGNYSSQVFDAGSSSSWYSLSWTPDRCIQCELADNQTVETGYSIVTNMTGNVLLMHFNNNSAQGENSTLFKDYSLMGNNGTCAAQSCPSHNLTGRFNQAYTFDGKDDNITLGDTLESTINGNHTIAVWIYPTANASETIIDKYNPTSGKRQWGVTYRGDFIMSRYGALNGATYRQYVTDTDNFPIRNWYHVVLVADPANDIYHFYLNGTEISGSEAGTGNITLVPDSNEPTRIGSGGGLNDYNFNGTMDEIAIWNRTLSAQEISDLYARGAMYLNFSVQSCDDASCSGESYTALTNSPGQTSQTLSLTTNRYIQFKAFLTTESLSITPKLYNVTITYSETYVPPVPEWSTVAMILILTISLTGFYFISKQN